MAEEKEDKGAAAAQRRRHGRRHPKAQQQLGGVALLEALEDVCRAEVGEAAAGEVDGRERVGRGDGRAESDRVGAARPLDAHLVGVVVVG